MSEDTASSQPLSPSPRLSENREARTLLTGMHYEIAATHADPRSFFDRMVRRYGLKLKVRTSQASGLHP